jgi:hypothetical protein
MRPGDRQRVASRWVGHCAGAFAAVWPLAAAHAAPLDNAIQSLNDVAFVSGAASATGGVIFSQVNAADHPALGLPFFRPPALDLAETMARPLPQAARGGLRLGGEVPVNTVGDLLQGKLRAMGVRDGATRYGGDGRFYLFAAVHGQAVGLNLQTQGGGLHRTGWSTDQTSALVGDGQVGLGWRKRDMEAAVGYVHRGVHFRNTPIGASDGFADDMAAVSFTLHMH